MAIGARFTKWGLGLFVFGVFLVFGIITHYCVGARSPQLGDGQVGRKAVAQDVAARSDHLGPFGDGRRPLLLPLRKLSESHMRIIDGKRGVRFM